MIAFMDPKPADRGGNRPGARPAADRDGDRLLTEVELELMTILWRLGDGGGSVNDVLESLPPERPLAYTSVSTILRILERKGVVKARKQGRGHLYVPRITKAAYEARSLRHLLSRVFDGAPAALVRCLVESEKLSPEDLRAIKGLLQARGAGGER
jgi:predicted transcriptional regulator